ncbi:pilus assembly protein TadE [Kitasatospora acidiphila]|uniref:Pilus assembly protein TadE n=1 Tax=Kitasatospora acidiphila TaxID=2567942 RepID=A0A540W6R0_9ACTN|nr:TadE family type IV pilus minor pilin [Kitasatospora acidiphila]TQF04637.1 pilus assembly protein TadE [Kitasatospora acidiphila]
MRSDGGGPGLLRRRLGAAGRVCDGGYVTAETAVLLPALIALMLLLVWGVLVAAAQLRCIDAARVAARAAARGDADPADQARKVAPPGAAVEVVESSDTVRVLVEAQCPGIGRLASTLKVSAVAVAASETASEATVSETTTGRE